MPSHETLRRLRDVLARELETISQYEAHAAAETDPEARALFQHLADEEKEHVSEVYEALLTKDAVQQRWASSGEHAQAIREHRFEDVASTGGAHPVPPAIAPASAAPVAEPISAPVMPVAVVPPPAPRLPEGGVHLPVRHEPGKPGIKPTPPTVGSLVGVPQT